MEVLELFFFENFPPLAESLGSAAGNFRGNFLPLVAVLRLERDNEILLFKG